MVHSLITCFSPLTVSCSQVDNTYPRISSFVTLFIFCKASQESMSVSHQQTTWILRTNLYSSMTRYVYWISFPKNKHVNGPLFRSISSQLRPGLLSIGSLRSDTCTVAFKHSLKIVVLDQAWE